MNILLIAPDQPGINNIPEVRNMSEMHRVHVFNGTVDFESLHDAVRHNSYDAIHFATHMKADATALDIMALSSDDYIDLDRAVSLCKLANARIAVFNLCLAARFAAYVVHRGIYFAIYTTVEIPDVDAWTLPVSFYERVRRAERQNTTTIDYYEILESINTGNGVYHWTASTNYFAGLITPIESKIDALVTQIERIIEIVNRHSDMLGSSGNLVRLPTNRKPIIWGVIIIVAIITLASLISLSDTLLPALGGLR